MSESRPKSKSDSDSAAVSTRGKTVAKSAKSHEPGTGRVGPVKYYRQSVAELRKVVWPTRTQLTTYFIVVSVFVIVVVAYVSLLDLGFGTLVLKVLG